MELMEITNIIYYTRNDDKSKTLSLRDLCLREEKKGLEAVFYTVRDAINTDNLLESFKSLCCENIELESENDSYIRFVITDIYDNINYLKFKKKKHTATSGIIHLGA